MGKRKVREDLTGKQFGRLTVIEQADDNILPCGQHKTMWLCECSCKEHNRVIVRAGHLKSGRTNSCGCLYKESRHEIGKKYHDWVIKDGVVWGQFSSGEWFCFSESRFEQFKGMYFSINNSGYARTCIDGKSVLLHHLIYPNSIVDHIDRNRLNNTDGNLRPCTIAENVRNSSLSINNTSGFTGVCWYTTQQKWSAEIKVDGKKINLYYGDSKEDAIIARLEGEAKYFGEFAPQRHLFEKYGIKIDGGGIDYECTDCRYR